MNIMLADISDSRVLELFSEHDDFMIAFLGEDSKYYTRYSSGEKIENVWVAYDGERPVGCIAFRSRAEGGGEVKRLFIRSEYRGKGISKSLLLVLKDHAAAQGCSRLFLDTRITLEPAFSMYRRSGFEIVFRQGLYVQLELKL